MKPFGLQFSAWDRVAYQKDSCELAFNTNLTSEPFKQLYLFCNGENILNNKAKGFFHIDETPAMLLACFNYEF